MLTSMASPGPNQPVRPEACVAGDQGRPHPVIDTQLGEHARHLVAYCLPSQAQPTGDPSIALARREAAEDVALAGGASVERRGQFRRYPLALAGHRGPICALLARSRQLQELSKRFLYLVHRGG